MSDRIANTRLYVLLKHGVASFALVFALGIFLVPQSAFALDEQTPENNTPVALPATCAALIGITPPPAEEPVTPGEDEETPAPATPAWSALTLTTAPITTNMNLTWNWQAPVPTDPESTYRGYGYALYSGKTLLASGELGADMLGYSYAAPVNGVYRLFVWVLDTTTDPTTPQATGCEYADTAFDNAPPIISIGGEGFTSSGKTATPTLSTAETDLTYSWTVTSEGGLATISNANVLNPIFTFLRDGVYTFVLTATDTLGNTALVTLTIKYEEPFIPTPEAPITPAVPAPIDPYVPPAVVLAEARRTVAVGASYEAAVSTDVMTNSESASSNVAGVNTDDTSSVAAASAQPVQRSDQGWVILGVPWYWWLLGLAIIISAIQWYRSGAFRKTPDDV